MGVAYSSEGQSITFMVGCDCRQADTLLEKELRVLHLAGNRKWSQILCMA